MKKIAVIGATGMLGKPVTRQLIKEGSEITIIARNPAKAQEIFPGRKIVQGDVFDKESLVKVFTGQDAIYLNLSPPRNARQIDAMPEREGIDNIIEAATQAGINRIAFLSSIIQRYNGMNGFNWWIFDMKQSAVTKIKSSGISYTIYYASTFLETIDQSMIRGNKIMLAGKSKAPMYFIAGEDYGRQVARSFQTLTSENKEYPIQGPEAYTWDDAARIFKENYTRAKLKIMKVPLDLLKFLGIFNRTINYGYMILEALNNYPEKFESELTWQELGKPDITLKEYAATR